MLTNEDIKALCERFKPGQHGFLPKIGKPYVEEFAVTSRLDKIDPSWEWKHVSSNQRDNQLIYVGALTVKGVTRVGTGMQEIKLDKETHQKETNEPEKSAETDALKRAARKFGIGRYLLVAPDSVQDQASLKTWFDSIDASRQKQAIESGEATEGNGQEKPASAQLKPESNGGPDLSQVDENGEPVLPEGQETKSAAPKWWKAVTTDKELVKAAGSQELLAALLKDAIKEGKIKATDTVQMAKDFARELATADIPF